MSLPCGETEKEIFLGESLFFFSITLAEKQVYL